MEPVSAFIKYSRAAEADVGGAGGGMMTPMFVGGGGRVVPGGAKVSFTAASPLQIAASAACADAMLEQYAHERARASAAAAAAVTAGATAKNIEDEAAELVVTFQNSLARPAYLRLPSSSPGAPPVVICIPSEESTEVRRPRIDRDVTLPTSVPSSSSTPALRHSSSGGGGGGGVQVATAEWGLAITLRSARGLPLGGGLHAVGGSEVIAVLDVSFPGGVHPVEAVPSNNARHITWTKANRLMPPDTRGRFSLSRCSRHTVLNIETPLSLNSISSYDVASVVNSSVRQGEVQSAAAAAVECVGWSGVGRAVPGVAPSWMRCGARRHAHQGLSLGGGHHGGAVQVDPIKPVLEASGPKRLKLKYDEPLPNFAFKFNLRHCITAAVTDVHAAAGNGSELAFTALVGRCR